MAKSEIGGYAGKILFVNLSERRTWEEPLDRNTTEKVVGGLGLGFRLLFDILRPNTDPLSPDNPIVVGLGPLGGTLVPGSGKCALTMKYPILASRRERKYFVSNAMGGSRRFGTMLKNAGYDHVVITGRSETPCYLVITDEGTEIRNATDIWGKDIHQTNEILLGRHRGSRGKCGTWIIGQAGENQVIISQATLDNFNSLGRHVGAVLGAKNLKAVVTYGKRGIKINDADRFIKAYNAKKAEVISHPRYQPLPRLHSTALQELYTSTFVGIRACTGCLGACRSIHEAKDGQFKGQRYQGGDFSVSVDFARRLRLDDVGAMYKLMDLMNRYGLCMLTTIRMIYFVTCLFRDGVISKEDTGGLELHLGDVNSYVALIEKIVRKQDIGAAMADGWYVLADKLGVDASTEFKIGCSITKGIDTLIDSRFWPSHLAPTMGFTNIVHSKGKHVHGATYWPPGPDLKKETYWPESWQSLNDIRRDTERMGLTKEELAEVFRNDSFDSAKLAMYSQDAEYLYNALGMCAVVVHWQCDPFRDVPWLSEVYSAITGIETSPRELLRAGERIWNLERLLNIREGFTKDDDAVPPVWLQNTEIPVKLQAGEQYLMDWFGNRITKDDIERMLSDYYAARGWDQRTGAPTKEKLIELGLNELVDLQKL